MRKATALKVIDRSDLPYNAKILSPASLPLYTNGDNEDLICGRCGATICARCSLESAATRYAYEGPLVFVFCNKCVGSYNVLIGTLPKKRKR
jgi:hypothetical protein